MKRVFLKSCRVALLALATMVCGQSFAAKSAAPLPSTGKFSTAHFYAIPSSNRVVYNFNTGWRFFKGDVKGAEQSTFDDSSWEKAVVPHGLELLEENASGGRNYLGKAWYRKKFNSEATAGERQFIYFEAVMGKCKVWVNGKLVAEHFGGYLPFAADVTDALNKDGKANVVAVLADNSNDTTYLPGKNQSGLDFSYLGGIYRDVYMISTSSVYVTLPQLSKRVAGGGVFVATLSAKDGKATVVVRTEVENKGAKKASVTIKSTLEDMNFKAIKSVSSKSSIAVGENGQVEQKMALSDVRLWHPEDPYLHYIRTEVIVGGKVVDSFRTRFGIRTIEMMGPKGFYVNGKPYETKLIGANRHQDYVYVGNALPNSGQWRDVKLLREGGCNIVRAAHYPQDDAFYDACDEFGMFVTTANPGWHFFNFKDKIFEERLYQDTRDLVRKDRNRPSMIMWETALNETPQQPAHAMSNMHKAAHEEYPFPGMYTVTDYKEAKAAGLDMYYHGSDPEINSFTRECGDGGEVDSWYAHNAVTRVKMEWGEKALINQSEQLVKTLNSLHSTGKVRLGGTLWAGIEHQRGYHPDPFWGGLMNVYRLPKYSYYLWQSQYDANYKIKNKEVGPMLYITNELTQVSPSDIYIYSNCDEIKLSIGGKVIATQKPSKDGKYNHLPHAPFVFKNAFNFNEFKSKGKSTAKAFKSTVVAEGYIDGKLAITTKKEYALRAEKLTLEAAKEGMELVADGSDFVPIRCYVEDDNGTRKVLASENITFTVEGEGEIIGGQANMANPIKTQFGVATILVRSTSKPGKIKITAYSGYVKAGTLEINSVASDMPFMIDEKYESSSKVANADKVVISNASNDDDLPTDVKTLQAKLKVIEQELVGKDQEIMELRSQVK